VTSYNFSHFETKLSAKAAEDFDANVAFAGLGRTSMLEAEIR
jgi:hypothetical protein